MRLKDKVALIIGCSPNIGRSIARIFAKEGAAVVVDDIKEEAGKETVSLIEKAGGKAVFTPADISCSEGLKDAVSCAVNTFGRLDIFVSVANAGNSRSVAEFDRSGAELCYAVNVLALIEGAHYCLPHIKKAGGGSIIAISSIQGVRGVGGNPGYAAAKAGIIGAARSMAVELWQHKIRVNVIYPSGVGGPTWEVIDQLGWDYLPEFEEHFGSDIRHLPLITGIDPIALGYAALFLASDEANYITGVTLPVDAGTSIIHYGVYKGDPPCETPERNLFALCSSMRLLVASGMSPRQTTGKYQQELYEKFKAWLTEKKSTKSS